jgi:hypothetical protein
MRLCFLIKKRRVELRSCGEASYCVDSLIINSFAAYPRKDNLKNKGGLLLPKRSFHVGELNNNGKGKKRGMHTTCACAI